MDHVSFSVGNADISTKMSDSNSEIQKKYLNETEDSDKDKKVARQNAKEAVSAYKMASLEEKRGNLNEAISLYRKAFKMNSQVELLLQEESDINGGSQEKIGIASTSKVLINTNKNPTIENLADSFKTMNLELQPRIKSNRTHISSMPDEIIVDYFLKFLILEDVASVELFGRACKKFYLFSRDQNLWKYACENIGRGTDLVLGIMDYRTLFINTPRIRHEGIYISRCTYVRPGASEFSFSQPVHLVTYYRYLRFYQNGTVISALSNSEPQQIVHKISKRTFSNPTVFDRDTRILRGHYFVQDKRNVYVVVSNEKTVFHIHLRLSSTYKGGWNKFTWIEYYSVTNNERSTYSLQSFKNFFFSRVKRYLTEE